MRTLSSTLIAAQKDPSSVPFVRVTVSDQTADVVRLRWERLYAGSETDAYHALAIPNDGALLRLRVDPAGPALYWQRITAPDDQSDYSSWTSLGTVADADVALAASGSDVIRAYIASNGNDIKVEESSDNGASFGSAVTAAGLANVTWLAIALKGNGDALLLYADATTVYTVRRTSSSWATPAAWPYSANSIEGIAVALFGDFHFAIAGTDASDNPRLWTAVYGDGFARPTDTWSALYSLAEADNGSAVSFHAPFLAYTDTARLFFVESYAGTVAYSRPQWTWVPPGQSFDTNSWREPAPFDLHSELGTAIAGDGSHSWLTTPGGVWRASLDLSEIELGGDVLEVSLDSRPFRGGTRIVLRNDDGRYNDLANGPYSVVRHGAQVKVDLGVVTTQGEEVCTPGLKYWVERWEHTTAGGDATFVLHAVDAWFFFERRRARRQHTWQADEASVAAILTLIANRAGVELVSTGTSGVAANHKPAFTIHPGESGLQAIRRLLAMVPDAIRFSDVVAQLFEPEATDGSDYAYGPGNHPIYSARYGSPEVGGSRVQVFGDELFAEGFDWPAVEDQQDSVSQVLDLNLSTQPNVEDRVATVLRDGVLVASRGEIVTPVNCGQELYDVISITDPTAGLADELFRVIGVDVRFVRGGGTRRSPVYEQRLVLGNV